MPVPKLSIEAVTRPGLGPQIIDGSYCGTKTV